MRRTSKETKLGNKPETSLSGGDSVGPGDGCSFINVRMFSRGKAEISEISGNRFSPKATVAAAMTAAASLLTVCKLSYLDRQAHRGKQAEVLKMNN